MTDQQRIRQLEEICHSQQVQLDFQLQRLNQITDHLKNHGVHVPGATVWLSNSDTHAIDAARRL